MTTTPHEIDRIKWFRTALYWERIRGDWKIPVGSVSGRARERALQRYRSHRARDLKRDIWS